MAKTEEEASQDQPPADLPQSSWYYRCSSFIFYNDSHSRRDQLILKQRNASREGSPEKKPKITKEEPQTEGPEWQHFL